MLPQLSQELLDQLAAAWSRLDQARPATLEEVPQLTRALAEWLHWAIRIDDELSASGPASYPALRASAAGGAALPGLRHVHRLVEDEGRSLTDVISFSVGSPPVFHDAAWRPFGELPPLRTGEPIAAEEAAYRVHLEELASRTPAAAVTRFLLDAALDRHDDLVQAVE